MCKNGDAGVLVEFTRRLVIKGDVLILFVCVFVCLFFLNFFI